MGPMPMLSGTNTVVFIDLWNDMPSEQPGIDPTLLIHGCRRKNILPMASVDLSQH